eukprot:CAMPEP_0194577770 /NCGR_PEP_ID=MMETSP0292-20121207/12432_1 /TAXON_ID=39354 /ORGANISM="Heterosigma akashiwo, Strain CCMP2393" /LENGTH=43 /DNA_ID= /DNA_START= /DNA_END= /DNA_ORIENTATION=
MHVPVAPEGEVLPVHHAGDEVGQLPVRGPGPQVVAQAQLLVPK